MLVELEAMSNDSKIWIYQSNRALTEQEILEVHSSLQKFAAEWLAHGAAVKGWAGVVGSYFLVFAADDKEHGVSGCSIDGSVRLVREWGTALGIDLFERLNLACETLQGIQVIHRDQLQIAMAQGILSMDTPVYDNTVLSLGEWKQSWKKPLSNTWASAWITPVNRVSVT